MKSPRNTISLCVLRGKLRIRLPRFLFVGEQKYLYLQLEDNVVNREIAKTTIKEIEVDLAKHRFDYSLSKYKPKSDYIPIEKIDFDKLWSQYLQYKSKFLESSSLKDLRRVQNHLKRISKHDKQSAKLIKRWADNNLSQDASRRLIMQLNACCKWAVDQDMISHNPFENIKKGKIIKQETIDPFSKEERDLIINAFENSPQYSCFSEFVKFLFFTGCRPSEAIALTWNHISGDFITFKDAIVEGIKKDKPKNRKIRKFPINQQIRTILESIPCHEDNYLFHSQEGELIDLHNFTNRAWASIVSSLNIRHRPTYNTRHTFITLCLDQGVPIAQVAHWVGNSPKTILDHYAGLTRSSVPLL